MKKENTKLSIWCISKYASPPKYGVGTRLFYVAREFSYLGHDTILISSDSNHLSNYPKSKKIYNTEFYGNLKHIFIKTLKYRKNASLKRFLTWFDFNFKLLFMPTRKLKKPDVVIVSSLALTTIWVGIYYKLKFRCKLIFEVRDIYPLTLIEDFKVNRFNPIVLYFAGVEKIGYKYADLIVGTMPNLIEHVKNIINIKKDVYFSPIGIHENWFNNDYLLKDDVKALFPNDGRTIIGYAGSIGISNALETFIEVIEEMKSRDDILFVIVGNGDLRKTYKKRLINSKNVIFGPKINQKDIPGFLENCDILYLAAHDSKIWDYGQSLNKMIDYMMSGKPIIASYSGYQSMLNEAESGFFVPTYNKREVIDKINKLIAMSFDERLQMGAKGKEWIVDNHLYSKIGSSYINKIMEIING